MNRWALVFLAAICTYKVWIEGPRWAGIRQAVAKACFERDLDDLTTEDKGLIYTVVYVKVRGDCDAVEQFRKDLKKGIEDYEKN